MAKHPGSTSSHGGVPVKPGKTSVGTEMGASQGNSMGPSQSTGTGHGGADAGVKAGWVDVSKRPNATPTENKKP